MNSTKKSEIRREQAHEAFYREIRELKPRLPKDWRVRFFLKNPAYDSYQGGVLLTNVLNFRTTDTVVLASLKEIVSESENQKT